MSKNIKELIFESFQKMDLNMLDVLLDDNKTYQDARKEVFLEKISDAFLTFKENGDTHLMMLPGSCKSTICPNRGSTGYSFIGNNSKKHIDLIFHESDNNITDIFHCNEFETNDKSITKKNRIKIDIQDDEKLVNEHNPDFLIEIRQFRLAYNELYRNQDIIIDKTIYKPWLRKHYKLYESICILFTSQVDTENFYWLYYRIKGMSEHLKYNDSAKEAFDRFQQINEHDEKQLLKWLTEYEDLGQELTLFMYEGLNYQNPEETEYFIVNDLKIATSDFENIARFKFIMNEYYYAMLEKYNTFSQEKIIQYANSDSEMSDYISSLTYHLNKRGGISFVGSTS